MKIIEQAQNRMRNRQWDENIKGMRYAEFRDALERLDEAEYRASFPDNPDRITQLEQIRRTRDEITAMMDEEFGLKDEYRRIADS